MNDTEAHAYSGMPRVSVNRFSSPLPISRLLTRRIPRFLHSELQVWAAIALGQSASGQLPSCPC